MTKATRRQFVGRTVTGLGALYAGLPESWNGTLYASDAPERADMKLGFVAVDSCAPIIMGHEKGIFKKYGLTSSVSKENGWAATRDKLISGENQATHLKYSQSVASNLGAQGGAKVPMITPWTMNRKGSAFLISTRVKEKLGKDPQGWVEFAHNTKKATGAPPVIALPVPIGFHMMIYRYLWALGGLDPEKDFKLITLPPAQMIQNMKVGAMSACAMVEPWPSRGVRDKVAYVAFYGHEMWPDHPVKGFTFLEKFQEKNPKTVIAALRAMHEASVYCDNPANHMEIAKTLSTTNYLNSPIDTLMPYLNGVFDYGTGKVVNDPNNIIRFSKNNCNYPQTKEMMWFMTQFRRWGMIEGVPDYKGVTARICRADIYKEAMKGVGFTDYKEDNSPIVFWDGKPFNPAEPEKYATSFPIKALKG